MHMLLAMIFCTAGLIGLLHFMLIGQYEDCKPTDNWSSQEGIY